MQRPKMKTSVTVWCSPCEGELCLSDPQRHLMDEYHSKRMDGTEYGSNLRDLRPKIPERAGQSRPLSMHKHGNGHGKDWYKKGGLRCHSPAGQ